MPDITSWALVSRHRGAATGDAGRRDSSMQVRRYVQLVSVGLGVVSVAMMKACRISEVLV